MQQSKIKSDSSRGTANWVKWKACPHALSDYIHCTRMLLFRYWWYFGPLMHCDVGMTQRPGAPPQKATSCASTQVKPRCCHQGSRDCSQTKYSWALNLQSSYVFMWTSTAMQRKCSWAMPHYRNKELQQVLELGLKGRINKEEPFLFIAFPKASYTSRHSIPCPNQDNCLCSLSWQQSLAIRSLCCPSWLHRPLASFQECTATGILSIF